MIDELQKMIDGVDADFVDIRYEIKNETNIHYVKRELKEIGSNTTDGYVVRALKGGGFSSTTVTRKGDLPVAIKRVLDAANLMAKITKKPVKLADAPVIKDRFSPGMNGDPRDVDIEEKINLLKGYNELILSQPEISATDSIYFEVHRKKFYLNSEGSIISEELMTTGIASRIYAKSGSLVQDVSASVGGSQGMKKLYDREDVFLNKARIARELLNATPVKSGKYTVLLNPLMTGLFTHEAFGHFSEADIIEDNATLRKKMTLGAKLGSEILNITADSTLPDQLGFYKYDDEGVAVRPVNLIEKGILSGRLHSRRTAAAFNEPISGHSIAEDYRYPPIVRMGTIFVKPGGSKFDELLETVKDGVYLLDTKGGQTAGENFTFAAQYGYLIKNGEVGPMIREINLIGNLFTTLANIIAVGDDFQLSERGGCGKGQMNIRSALGGPHTVIRDAIIGGI